MSTATSSQAALKQLQSYQKSSLNPNDILGQQRQQLGVNETQDTVTGLRGAINNTTKLLQQVAPSVMGRTGSSLVTNAQATRQIQNEQAPISQNLSDQSTQYGQAADDLSRLEQRAGEAASGIYQGQQDKQSYLQNLYNALYQKESDSAERKRQAALDKEAKRQFNLQLQESRADRAASSKSIFSPSIGTPAPVKKASKTNSVQQAAYNDVKSRLGSQSDAQLISDFKATAKSAGYGNARDKAKVQLYQQMRPDLFSASQMFKYTSGIGTF